jgi:hypothetical protein
MLARFFVIAVIMICSVSCKKNSSSASSGGAAQPNGVVEAEATVTQDLPVDFVQAGDSIEIVGTNLTGNSDYKIEVRLLSADKSLTVFQGSSNFKNFPLEFIGSGYAIIYTTTPDGRTLAAVTAQAYENQTANIRFDRTSTAAAKLLEIIAEDSRNGNPDARSAISNYLISVPQLYGLGYSALMVFDEQQRRIALANREGKSVNYEAVNFTTIARGLASSVQTAYQSSGLNPEIYAKQESVAAYMDFYKNSADTPSEISAFRSSQSATVDIAYEVARANPLVASAYSDASSVFRPPVDSATAGAISTKVASIFMDSFAKCTDDNQCNSSQPIAPKIYAPGGIVAAPLFEAIGRGTGTEKIVRLSSPTPNATIYYTTDGTDPTQTSSKYGSPVTVKQSQVIKAMAISPGMTNSQVAIGAPYSKSFFDHEWVLAKEITRPSFMMEGDLIILVVMHKYDPTDTAKIVDPIVPTGFYRFQKSEALTGPSGPSDAPGRYQHVSIYTKTASANEPLNYKIAYPDNVDPDQLIASMLTIRSLGGLRDYKQGAPVSMEEMAQIPAAVLDSGETVVYVATSLYLAEAIDDRENTMLFNNINSDDQHNYNPTAVIMESNMHWRNKLGVTYDNQFNNNFPVDGFWASRGFGGQNLANSNMGLRFIVTP